MLAPRDSRHTGSPRCDEDVAHGHRLVSDLPQEALHAEEVTMTHLCSAVHRRTHFLLMTLITLVIITYVTMYDRRLLTKLNCAFYNQSHKMEKILLGNKTLILLETLTFPCNDSEIVISRKFLEDAKIVTVKQSKVAKRIPERDVVKVNCSALFARNDVTIKKVKQLTAKEKRHPIPDSYYINATRDCNVFRRKRGYILESMTSEEEDFSIAYSMLMFKDVNQVERLLRAIYRPQNYYCIHVDKKASKNVLTSIRGIANCFSNVFLTSKSVNVTWGTFTVLEPELICMKELWRYRKWKYFINLTGQEFPLMTNLDIVRILKGYNGANDIESGSTQPWVGRWKNAGKPPHNLKIAKGGTHVMASRGYVDYILHSQVAKDLLPWVKKTYIPDETYFATLNHNPQLRVPGSYKVKLVPGYESRSSFVRFVNWGNLPCTSKFVRGVCIIGVGELHLLVKARQLFANKFYLDFEPYALDCMEEWLYNRTRDEYLGVSDFDNSFYKKADFVVNKI